MTEIIESQPRCNTPQRLRALDATDDVLQASRVVVRRLDLIKEEVILIVGLLKQGRISPRTAVELVEEVAPGCINLVAESIIEGPAQ